MPLQLVVDNLDAIPEPFRGSYKEVDGKFRLDLEGYEDPAGLKSALQKERDANRDASKKLGAWSALGKTPEEIAAALQAQRDLEEKLLIEQGKQKEVDERRTEYMKAEHEKVLKAEKDARATAEGKASKLASRALNGAIRDAAVKAGALPEAMDDIVLRAGVTWRLNDEGDPVAMNGDDVVLGKDGKTPLTPIEWAESLRESAPHLWPRAQGSGAQGNQNRTPTGVDLSKLSPVQKLNYARSGKP